jgi:hypothetical protein
MIFRKSQNLTCNPFLYLKIPHTRPTGLCCAGLTRCGEQIRNAFVQSEFNVPAVHTFFSSAAFIPRVRIRGSALM